MQILYILTAFGPRLILGNFTCVQNVLTFTCPISCPENEEVENSWDGKYLEPSGKKTGSPPHLKKGKVTKVGLIDKSERKGKREEDNGQWIKPTRHCPAFIFDPRK